MYTYILIMFNYFCQHSQHNSPLGKTLIFARESSYVAQVGLELLGLSDPPG
jgi:hypothetical protein